MNSTIIAVLAVLCVAVVGGASAAYILADDQDSNGSDPVETAVNYTVSLAGEGVIVMDGDVGIASGSKVVYGTVLTVTIADKTGYTGSVEASEGEVSDGTYTVTGDVTFTGMYAVNCYTLTISYTGVPDALDTYTSAVPYGSEYSVISPAVTGYTPDITEVSGTMPAEDVAVTVYYSANSHTTANRYTLTITYTGTPHALNTYTSSITYGSEYSVTSPSVTGYTPNIIEVSGTMPAEDVAVTVVYTINTYTVVWKDDNTVLETDTVAYGTVPSYNGTVPTKVANTQYTYTFSGWSPEVVAAVADVTYTVEYTWTVNKYAVTIEGDGVIVMNDGASVSSGDKVDYGTVLTVTIAAKDGYSGTVSVSVGSISEGTYTVFSDVTFTGTYTESSETGTYGSKVSGIDGLIITFKEGTEGAYTLYYDPDTKEYTVVFTEVSADTEYSLSGTLIGSIVIDAGDSYEFQLDLEGLTVTSTVLPCIDFQSADKATISAKKGTSNYLYDKRAAVTGDDAISSAVYATMDLDVQGKGVLTVVSDNNNGIHSKDDLDVKNLTLSVTCADNALKGNDSVTIRSGTITLNAIAGDGIKTTNTDVSSKGNQRGAVTINSDEGNTVLTIKAACDGIDAAYDVVIGETEGNTVTVEIYTYTYAGYTATTSGSTSTLYISTSYSSYKYSVLVTKTDGSTVWESASTPFSSTRSFRSTTYYYSLDIPSDASKIQLFVYSSGQSVGQSGSYYACSETKTVNSNYNMLRVKSVSSGSVTFDWANYSSQSSWGGRGGMGPGGMNDGNSNKLDYSAKGIKADNSITIRGGTITVKAYDDAIHANADVVIESTNAYGKGSVTVSGGTLTLYSYDDGIHADGTLTISGGTVAVCKSYEGLEGNNVVISGGSISVTSSDDGVNATATSGTALSVSGGYLYVYAGGDGLDSNSRTSKTGLVFSGGTVVVISTSGGNSSIDTEGGYTYSGGKVLAVCPSNSMTQEVRNCSPSSALSTGSVSLGDVLTVSSGGNVVCAVKMPVSMNSFVACIGFGSVTVSSGSGTFPFDENGVYLA